MEMIFLGSFLNKFSAFHTISHLQYLSPFGGDRWEDSIHNYLGSSFSFRSKKGLFEVALTGIAIT